MSSKIDSIDKKVAEPDVLERGLTIENIVATLDLGNEYDLMALSEYLSNSEYEPETHPFLVHRPQSMQGTVLIPTNGKVSLVGLKNKSNLRELGSYIIDELSQITDGGMPDSSTIEVQNIVLQGDINHELELPPIVVLLGMENAEYEPEQFPGVIYKPDDGTTILIFGSGKFMVNGATTYQQAVSSISDLFNIFAEAEVPGDFEDFEMK